MDERAEIYRRRKERVKAIIRDRFKGKKVTLAHLIEVPPSTVSRWLMDESKDGYQNIGEKNARKIERILDLPDFELDAPDGNHIDEPVSSAWPFDVTRAQYERADEAVKALINAMMSALVGANLRSEKPVKIKTARSKTKVAA